MVNTFACMEQPEFRKNLISRINRIDGQIRGIEKMILSHQNCDNILNQISSVKSALNGVAKVILEVHLRSCIVHDIKTGFEEEAISTLIDTLNDFIYAPNKILKNNNENIIRKIENQIKNIRVCIDRNECCSSVLKVVATIKLELNSMAKVILEEHVKHCLANDIKHGPEDKIIDEFLYTINKMMK